MPSKPKLNYVEFSSLNVLASKHFFSTVFDWQFTDYGKDYSAFSNAGLEGGIFTAERVSQAQSGAPLLVFYSSNLTQTLQDVEKAGGSISKPIPAFPGGCRFHFIGPGGNELAVWSEKAE